MRPAEPEEMPRTALSTVKLAEAHGWEVESTYAEGTWEARGKEPKTVTSIAVRMRKPGARLVALWKDGKFWTGLTPTKKLSATEIKEVIQRG